jgi:hypothetical protein
MTSIAKAILAAVATLTLSVSAMALTFDSNVPANIKAQATDDLTFMYQLQGNGQTPFHQEIFKSVDGKAYQAFFESHIQALGMNDCGGGAAVACVIPFFNPHKMWLTKNFVDFSHPQIARLMVMFHESRHSETEHGNWAHDYCPTPFLDKDGKDMKSIWTGAPLAGEPACDSTYKGSYGSSTVLLANVSKYCSNCSDKVKMDANIYAMDQLGRIDDEQVKQSMIDDFAK